MVKIGRNSLRSFKVSEMFVSKSSSLHFPSVSISPATIAGRFTPPYVQSNKVKNNIRWKILPGRMTLIILPQWEELHFPPPFILT